MRQCSICGKSSIMRAQRKKLRGKYNPLPKKRKYPNLQLTRLADGKRVLACAQCIKTKSRLAASPRTRGGLMPKSSPPLTHN